MFSLRTRKFYSQCGEDQIVFEKYFPTKRNGIFLEMGALDGVTYSNTKFFEDHMAWTGILIEPVPSQYTQLVRNRPSAITYNCIVSTNPEPMEIYVNGAVSSVKEFTTPDFYMGWHKPVQATTVTIPTRRLDSILHELHITHIDFWSLDVEGAEYDVLQTMDWSIPVGVICMETCGGDAEYMNEQCRQLLRDKGYKFDGKAAHNELWVKE
jgi:FkbM family methyltransferase